MHESPRDVFITYVSKIAFLASNASVVWEDTCVLNKEQKPHYRHQQEAARLTPKS